VISKTVQSLPKTPQRLRICHRWRKTGYIGYRRTLQHWRYVSIIVVIWTYFHCGKRAAVPIHMHHGHRRRSSWNSEGDAWWAPKVGRCRMGWVWEGRPLSSQLRGLRERCELPQWGPDFGVFWRPQNAPFCNYLTKIWGGQFALASPFSKFWGDVTSSRCAMTLSWQYCCTSTMTYKPCKLGQTDLVFGLWSEFIRVYMCM